MLVIQNEYRLPKAILDIASLQPKLTVLGKAEFNLVFAIKD